MKRARIGVIALVLAGAFTSGCEDDGIYLMSQIEQQKDGEWADFGGGCMLALSDDFSGSGLGGGVAGGPGLPPPGDFEYEEYSDKRGVTVTVRSDGEVLEEREYNEAFLKSGEVDTFEVMTHAGFVYRLSYWGGPECDTSHLDVE